jgi:hypothetical protein
MDSSVLGLELDREGCGQKRSLAQHRAKVQSTHLADNLPSIATPSTGLPTARQPVEYPNPIASDAM